MAVETFPRSQSRSLLDRTFDLSRVNFELVAYVVIVILSVIAHLWGLGTMAMHHDESIHAWTSWRFYTGSGSFTCANGETWFTYCYDPVYHGPSLYVLTLFSYFLFGDGDAQARLPMALAGIGLVASSWMLRPYLGRRGALIAAVLLGFSPSLLYFTRFARHDGLMVLWELWMVIGIFRYLDTGRPGYLYLLATGLALAIGTHELYYILFFIFGIFLLVRLVQESPFAGYLNRTIVGILALCAALVVVSLLGLDLLLPFGEGLYLGEKAFLVGSTLLLMWLALRAWPPQPVVIPRFKQLWEEDRTTLWVAVAILVGIYLVLYTTFFAYPRGAIDGLYAGLAYWLGTQHEYARGDQPWYYYLMQLPLYEPLGVLCGIGAAAYLFTRRASPKTDQTASADREPLDETQKIENFQRELVTDQGGTPDKRHRSFIADDPARITTALFPVLLVFWYFNAIIIFSWAGEKMPWLLVHMALPGNLLAAWVLGQLLRNVHWRNLPDRLVLLIPPALVLLLVTLAVALLRLSASARGQEAQSNLLQGLVPLILAGALMYALLTLGQRFGTRIMLAFTGLTLACLLGSYMIRATWLAVYTHPDTPVELLVYTQTSPDIPRYVEDVRELAINLTRNHRTSDDVAGGLSMPIIIDSGNSQDGEGSLAWPLQWYFRDFQRLMWKNGDQFREGPTLQDFEVQLPDGSNGLVPVIMLHKSHVSTELRSVLQEAYAQPYGDGGVFNWWFPEGDKCSPQSPGYKRFYFNAWTSRNTVLAPAPKGCGEERGQAILENNELNPPWGVLVWPFQPANWGTLKNFVLYRDLPYPLVPGAREMEVWVRQDLVGGATEGVPTSASAGAVVRLVAEQAIGGPAQLTNPIGVAVDSQGTVYVADTFNHRIQVFNSEGALERTIGGFGKGENQFYEPRGVAVDADNNLYVADTWNARVVKIGPDGEWLATWGVGEEERSGRSFTDTGGTQAGNAAKPLGLYGPRGVAVDAQGNVYIADTGNKRIVVTDAEGQFLYQIGYAGSEPGAFNEPTSVAVDRDGNVYVADTWNGRVQVFQPQAGEQQVAPVPIATWRVSGWAPNTYEDPSIAVSPNGQVYVSVPLQKRVLAANLRGDIALRWGGPGEDLASLNAPSGIAVGPDGDVYVVDRDSARVLRFEIPRVKIGDE